MSLGATRPGLVNLAARHALVAAAAPDRHDAVGIDAVVHEPLGDLLRTLLRKREHLGAVRRIGVTLDRILVMPFSFIRNSLRASSAGSVAGTMFAVPARTAPGPRTRAAMPLRLIRRLDDPLLRLRGRQPGSGGLHPCGARSIATIPLSRRVLAVATENREFDAAVLLLGFFVVAGIDGQYAPYPTPRSRLGFTPLGRQVLDNGLGAGLGELDVVRGVAAFVGVTRDLDEVEPFVLLQDVRDVVDEVVGLGIDLRRSRS